MSPDELAALPDDLHRKVATALEAHDHGRWRIDYPDAARAVVSVLAREEVCFVGPADDDPWQGHTLPPCEACAKVDELRNESVELVELGSTISRFVEGSRRGSARDA